MTRTATIAACLWAVIAVSTAPAHAFQIGNAAANFCHEQITFAGFTESGLAGELNLSERNFDAEEDEVFVRLGDYIADHVAGIGTLNDAQKLVLVTLFVGVRYPDQAGFAVHDLRALREIHLAQEGQEEHFLRAVDQDGPEGDAQAVQSGRDFIWDVIEGAREEYFEDPDAQRMIEVKFWLEYYGDVKVRVWAPMFKVGRAIHALQDSFPHTIRSDDTMQIYSVLNFVEGLSTKWDERRDGGRHSDFVDDCTAEEVTPLVESATTATGELLRAVGIYFKSGERAAVDAVLDRWLTYEPGCGYDEGYCDSIFAEYAHREPTLPPLACTIEALEHRPRPPLLWRRR